MKMHKIFLGKFTFLVMLALISAPHFAFAQESVDWGKLSICPSYEVTAFTYCRNVGKKHRPSSNDSPVETVVGVLWRNKGDLIEHPSDLEADNNKAIKKYAKKPQYFYIMENETDRRLIPCSSIEFE